jgi:uncharacterized protein YukE
MTSGDSVAVGAKAFSSGKSLLSDLSDGNYLKAAKDAYGIGSLVKDVDDFTKGHSGALMGDPLEALIEAGLGFLLDLITPLKDALNLVTGDPEGLNDKAEEWAGVAASLRQLGPQTVQTAAATNGSWTGAAGDAFRTKIANFERGALSVAGQADHVADVLRVSATLMDGAQGIIKAIIASWVEYAILTEAAAAASAFFTFGASEAAGQAAVAGEAAAACGEGAETVSQASGMLERIAQVIREVEGEFSQLAEAFSNEASAMREAEGALRSASDAFASAGKQAATKAFKEGVEKSIKDAGIDTALGLGDDAIKSAPGQMQDGSESQQQIDSDLNFGS